jgi:MerR family mercuric resistance operon transcriptional regulator
MTSNLTIGKLAESSGVNVETIRYYQRRGLLNEPQKPQGSHRRYSTQELKRIQFIKRAQALGFTLNEIEGLLSLQDTRACKETQELAINKLDLIQQKIAGLSVIQNELSNLVKRCKSSDNGTACPIIDILVQG